MDIKQKQKEVLENSRNLWTIINYDIVYYTNTEWIRNNYNELFRYITSRLREMTKIFKRKSMDDDIKLIELSRLRLEIKNKISEIEECINEF